MNWIGLSAGSRVLALSFLILARGVSAYAADDGKVNANKAVDVLSSVQQNPAIGGVPAKGMPTAADKAQAELGKLFETGITALSQKDYPAAYQALRRAADQGYARAQSALAGMYLRGEGGAAPQIFACSDAMFMIRSFRGSDKQVASHERRKL